MLQTEQRLPKQARREEKAYEDSSEILLSLAQPQGKEESPHHYRLFLPVSARFRGAGESVAGQGVKHSPVRALMIQDLVELHRGFRYLAQAQIRKRAQIDRFGEGSLIRRRRSEHLDGNGGPVAPELTRGANRRQLDGVPQRSIRLLFGLFRRKFFRAQFREGWIARSRLG